jgi:hypothetical protein
LHIPLPQDISKTIYLHNTGFYHSTIAGAGSPKAHHVSGYQHWVGQNGQFQLMRIEAKSGLIFKTRIYFLKARLGVGFPVHKRKELPNTGIYTT